VRRLQTFAAWAAILVSAFAVRVLPIAAARPYIAYVDEGNFLHPAARILSSGGWDPGCYLYPQFPTTAALAAARAYAFLYRAGRGRAPWKRPTRPAEIYDELEPFELLLAARGIDVLLGMAIVALAAFLAARLAGRRAALWAALLSGLNPALVLRAPIATVDSWATLFVLLGLVLTDCTRTSRRPGLASLFAGAAAGCAFASKYPAAAILVAFAATTLLQRLSGKETLRRTGLAAAGLLAGAVLAMPALVFRAREVRDAIDTQAFLYSRILSPPLWRQAFVRAEWDLPYEHAELGLPLVALAALGLLAGCLDRRVAATLRGWVPYLAVCLVVYGRESFQPFRNLLPLTPLVCVAAALALARAERRLRRPAWLQGLVLAWIAVSFAAPLAVQARERGSLVDSRVQAVNWLVARIGPGDRVVVARELGFVQGELDRIGDHAEVHWSAEIGAVLPALQPRFVIAGLLGRSSGPDLDIGREPPLRAGYVARVRFGEKPTPPDNGWWRGNRQIVEVFERRSGAGEAAGQAAGEAAFDRICRRDCTAREPTKAAR
jgi:hypothetical protein